VIELSERTEPQSARVVAMHGWASPAVAVINEANSSGRPVVVTQNGQFVALITPLAQRNVESHVLAHDPELRNELYAELLHADESTDVSLDELDNRFRNAGASHAAGSAGGAASG
jgi:antitoxin (DNA-binding transcriptional repressor) of toxin-antitoxin stability system